MFFWLGGGSSKGDSDSPERVKQGWGEVRSTRTALGRGLVLTAHWGVSIRLGPSLASVFPAVKREGMELHYGRRNRFKPTLEGWRRQTPPGSLISGKVGGRVHQVCQGTGSAGASSIPCCVASDKLPHLSVNCSWDQFLPVSACSKLCPTSSLLRFPKSLHSFHDFVSFTVCRVSRT